jgi:AraC-like DNA-binding protein
VPAWKDAPAAPAEPEATSSPGDEQATPVRALVRRPASAEVFRTARFPAGPDLEPWVEYLWTVDWDLGSGPPVESKVISYPALHLTAEWGGPGEVRHGHPMPATLVHGAVSRVFTVQLHGSGAVVGVRFKPGGCFAWTGREAVGLLDRALPAAELLETGLARLHDEAAGTGPAERAALFRAALQAHAPQPDSADGELDDLVARMAADPTLVQVEQVVRLSGWSVRTLQRRFRRHLGVSPKWVLARFRLQEAALALEAEPAVDLAELAVRLGWYDQAHLTNDFRRMLGETPRQYADRTR